MRTLTQAEAVTRAALLRVTAYDVHLELSGATDFRSTTTVRFSSGAGATFLELDAELVSGEVDGTPLTLRGNRLEMTLTAGEHVATVVARCATTTSGEGLHRSVDPADGAVYLYAQAFLDDAQRVFACFDQPDLKATFALTVDAPEAWVVRSNTVATVTGGRHVFTPTERISTYLWTVAAGPWHGRMTVHDGIELGVWCRASLADHLEADELFHITRQCLDLQQQVFGRRYPFGASYDQVFVPDFNAGAMENPGMVTFSDELFLFRSRATLGRRRLRAQVIAHEMAHMWFGDLVTMRWWDDLWLNEAFAELMGVHTVDRATDYEGAWADFSLGRKAWGYRADSLPTTHPIAGDVTDNRAALLNFDGISYAKGASALRQLSAWLGEDVFFAGVRRYLDRHAWGNTELADLLTALTEVSGRDLSAWSQSWLRTTGTSTIRVLDGAVLQDGDRPHHLAVGLYDGHPLVRREQVLVDLAGPRTPVDLAPADLVLPNDGDLTFAKVRLDPHSLATLRTGLRTLADPLARALVWGSLWDSVRDGELAPGALVSAVILNVDGEDDPDLVTTLLAQARTAAVRLAGSPALEADLHAHHVASVQPPGSDLQLVLFRAALATAPGALAVPAGLVVDEDLRWQQLRRLAVLGLVDADRLQAEHAAAPTSTSDNHLSYALAARPDPIAKAAVWDELLGDGPLSNARARSLSAGFWQPDQDELLRPYVARYADQVPGLWERRTPQLAMTLTRLLFPATLVEPAVLELTATLVADGRPAGLRRVVLEARDDLTRALAARH